MQSSDIRYRMTVTCKEYHERAVWSYRFVNNILVFTSLDYAASIGIAITQQAYIGRTLQKIGISDARSELTPTEVGHMQLRGRKEKHSWKKTDESCAVSRAGRQASFNTHKEETGHQCLYKFGVSESFWPGEDWLGRIQENFEVPQDDKRTHTFLRLTWRSWNWDLCRCRFCLYLWSQVCVGDICGPGRHCCTLLGY